MLFAVMHGRTAVQRVVATVPRISTEGMLLAGGLPRGASLCRALHVLPTRATGSRARPFITVLHRSYATGTSKPKAKTPKSTATGKAKSGKKKTAAKAKPRKKVLTEEQKAKAQLAKTERKAKDEIKSLKATALVEPKGLPASAWKVLVSEMAKETRSLQGKEASARYKAFTPEELEHYNHLANQNRAANDAAYRKWLASHTPDQIQQANRARNLLRRRLNNTRGYAPIKDERQPKRALSPYIRFFMERTNSGDLEHIEFGERAKLVSKEWKELGQSEKKKYHDLQATDLSRYQQEFKSVFHRDPPSVRAAAAGA
ncbi:MAG: hypothetical protein M1838_000651 [Thelocarpon superellum]|nr:MAG: hypothetical protein M1838_000651 [Thelocarpon superellum]